MWFYTALFLIAGVAHFATPDFFLKAMPPYFPYPLLLNYVVGLLEIGIAIGFWTQYRQMSVWIGILLLIAFFSVHIWHIQVGKFPSLPTVSIQILWLRIFIQFLLIGGLWWLGRR